MAIEIITLDRPGSPPDFVGDEPMITTRDVMRMLNLGRTKVNAMVKSGELPSYRFGHARRFLRSDIVEAIQRFREGSHGKAANKARKR